MNVVVIGAGAVGGFFGAKLARSGASVTFLVRNQRLQQIRSQGLRIRSGNEEFAVFPTVTTTVSDIEAPELALLAVKNYHLTSVLPNLQTLVHQGAVILPLLNGIGHIERLVQEFGKEHVMGGACYIESTLESDGTIIHSSSMQDIVYGWLGEPDTGMAERLQHQFVRASISARRSSDILAEMWVKYVFLACLSGITAVLRDSIGVAIEDEITWSFLETMVQEAAAIAQAQHPQVPPTLVEDVLKRFKSVPPTMTSSLQRDLQQGKPLEVESLQGDLIRMGNEMGAQIPNLNAVYSLLHPYRDGIY